MLKVATVSRLKSLMLVGCIVTWKTQARVAREREEERRTKEEFEKENALQVDHSFPETALTSAMAKLTQAATR